MRSSPMGYTHGVNPVREPRDDADGVDVTLIRWMLSLTPRERLEVLSSAMNSLEKIRGAAGPR